MSREYEKELALIIQTVTDTERLYDELSNYHLYDVASALYEVTEEERRRVYAALGDKETAELFSYLDDPEEFIAELEISEAAKIIEEMDPPDAAEILLDVEDEDREKITSLMDSEAMDSLKRTEAYEEDKVGAYMTDNYVVLGCNSTVPAAMSEMIRQAGEKDNIQTLFVTDTDGCYRGAVELKELILSRREDDFSDLIIRSYPFVYDDEEMNEVIERLKSYAEDSIPVLDRAGKLAGVLTGDVIVEAADEEMREDFAKLGGVAGEEDESVLRSVKNRLPWLLLLLFLGIAVSTVVGLFEGVIASLPVLVFFQTMILGMAGNAGTQSLAVSVLRLSSGRRRGGLYREISIGLMNGVIMGVIATLVVFLYVNVLRLEVISGAGFSTSHALLAGGAVGLSMLISITVATLGGASLPRLLSRVGIDPAVASGPFITTLNDVIAVMVYYGLCLGLFSAYIP